MAFASPGTALAKPGVVYIATPGCPVIRPPSVGHVDGGLLVPSVYEGEASVRHHVEGGQNVVAGEG